MLITMKEMLNRARSEGYGIAAPNIRNEDTLRAVISVAEELNAPIILDIYEGEEPVNPDIFFFGRMCEALAKDSKVPVCINQDHGETFKSAIRCIKAGFTSIMVDRSLLSFEENVKEVAELTRIAHCVDVSVEAELGHVGTQIATSSDESHGENDKSVFTVPEEAKRFVELTNVDCLAVSIGNAHGNYKGTPYIDFDLLHKLYESVDVPLVLHGGSGTGDDNLRRATREGITKINLSTDLFQAAAQAWEKAENKTRFDFNIPMSGYKDKLKHYMEVFGQVNKAWRY